MDFCYPYSAAVVFDAGHFDAAQIYREMMQRKFYTSPPELVYWETEEPKLLKVVAELLL